MQVPHPHLYMYVVARDFGFAPNPFHGACTLACCKPAIRSTTEVDDWVVGIGGRKLKAVGKCVFAMQVTQTMSFDEYWSSPDFRAKRPVRNGSRKMMIGDNIYSRDNENNEWDQLNSHHSQPDGRPDASNIARDTSTNRVLISEHFIYFGESAPEVPEGILDALGYENRIGHRVFPLAEADALLGWVATKCEGDFKRVLGDPFQFRLSGARYSVGNDRIENLTVLPPGIVELNTTDLL